MLRIFVIVAVFSAVCTAERCFGRLRSQECTSGEVDAKSGEVCCGCKSETSLMGYVRITCTYCTPKDGQAAKDACPNVSENNAPPPSFQRFGGLSRFAGQFNGP